MFAQKTDKVSLIKMFKIFTLEQMKNEIRESHKRSEIFGINKNNRRPDQKKLSPEALDIKKQNHKDLLDLGHEYINEFYDLLSPDQFMIAIVCNEGYILHLDGSDDLKKEFLKRNYAPGFRFTEKDVGTTATSLCLAKKIPVQINDKEHYCKIAHEFTSSAAPIFGKENQLQGILVVSGKSHLIHPHTLIMIVSAARSIEKQIHLIQRNRQLLQYSGFLNNVLESAQAGLLIVDNSYRIWMTNPKARLILKHKNPDGAAISIFKGLKLNLDDMEKHPATWTEKECLIRHPEGNIHLIVSAQPVISEDGQRLGAVIVFEEVQKIKTISAKLSSNKPHFTFAHLVGNSPKFLHAIDLAKRAALSETTILILGETGTGKELFAQAIHNAGPSVSAPFIPVNCGAIPAELMESEMFGYVDGAFSGALKGGRPGKFELADNGTMLLDEIGDMPHNMQVKLLRILQTGEVHRIGSSKQKKVKVRIIASTNINIKDAISQNRFRMDLYYRLNILSITIPPLRDRGAKDIQSLAFYFIQKYKPQCHLSPNAIQALVKYNWPGNVRELENVIQRALHICDGDTLHPEHLNLPEKKSYITSDPTGSIQEMEQKLISSTLENSQYNMAQTAKILGISRATLYRKIRTNKITKNEGSQVTI